jgi:hypothetical protein
VGIRLKLLLFLSDGNGLKIAPESIDLGDDSPVRPYFDSLSSTLRALMMISYPGKRSSKDQTYSVMAEQQHAIQKIANIALFHVLLLLQFWQSPEPSLLELARSRDHGSPLMRLQTKRCCNPQEAALIRSLNCVSRGSD